MLNNTLLVYGLVLGLDVVLDVRDVDYGFSDSDHCVLDVRIEVVIHIIILDKIELEENLVVTLKVDHILDSLAEQILDLGDLYAFIGEINRNLAE